MNGALNFHFAVFTMGLGRDVFHQRHEGAGRNSILLTDRRALMVHGVDLEVIVFLLGLGPFLVKVRLTPMIRVCASKKEAEKQHKYFHGFIVGEELIPLNCQFFVSGTTYCGSDTI